MTRAEAAAHLWDSKDTHVSLGNMRQLILRMQRSMPMLASVVAVDERSLRIVDPSHVDVCCLLDTTLLSGAGDLPTLMNLYRGDLLSGLEVPSADEAISVARTYLRERYFGLAYNVLKELTRYGRADVSAIQAWERHALAIDPAREETFKALISAYGAIGRADESRRVFAMLSDTLRREGAGGPQSDTRVMLARATTKPVGLASEPVADQIVGTKRPRVALLAPRWVSTSGARNYQRAFIEDIANELARYRSIVALAAHSSFQVSDDGGSLYDNSVLRADYTVSTIVRPGHHLGEISIRLVGSKSKSIVWAAEYPLANDLIIKSNRLLVARIVSSLADAIERDSLVSLERTKQASAYLMYLEGQQAMKTCDLRSVRRARRSYIQSIKEDRQFSDAYSGVSCSLYLEWLLLGGNDPVLLAEARDTAELAIEYDPCNSAGHWRKAMVALYQHDFDSSQECFERALDLHPNSADILLDQSDAMGFVGDSDLAWSIFQQALDLNPTPPDHYWWAGASVAFSQADYAKAIALCGRLSNDESVLRLLAASHGQLGNRTQAREYGRRLAENYPGETAESMTRLQPHRTKANLQPFVEGLRIAGVK